MLVPQPPSTRITGVCPCVWYIQFWGLNHGLFITSLFSIGVQLKIPDVKLLRPPINCPILWPVSTCASRLGTHENCVALNMLLSSWQLSRPLKELLCLVLILSLYKVCLSPFTPGLCSIFKLILNELQCRFKPRKHKRNLFRGFTGGSSLLSSLDISLV